MALDAKTYRQALVAGIARDRGVLGEVGERIRSAAVAPPKGDDPATALMQVGVDLHFRTARIRVFERALLAVERSQRGPSPDNQEDFVAAVEAEALKALLENAIANPGSVTTDPLDPFTVKAWANAICLLRGG